MELQLIKNKIVQTHGHRVILDFHLAELYGVETKVLKQAVNRNRKRFPSDFMLELNQTEYQILRSQFVTLEGSSSKGRHSKYAAYEVRKVMAWWGLAG